MDEYINEFTKELKEKYPLLFPTNEQEPISLFGIECGKGWDHIVRAVCHMMYQEYRSAKRSYDYWSKSSKDDKDLELVEKYKLALEAAEQKMPKLAQVKEKFGTMRLYVDNSNPYVNGLIDMAEAMSEVTCEVCGSPGKTYTMGWHKTLCLEHARERYGKVVDIPELEKK
jgi:hypothetical protein